jgi:translocation and assembly module TamA
LSARTQAASFPPAVRILLVSCAVLAACATPSTPFEGHPVLVAIDFAGNNSISAGDLRDKIATQATSGFFSKTARYYDADLFAIDQKRIVRWYNEKGFYEAKIKNVEEQIDREGRVRLVVHIDEGRRARISSIEYQGQEPLRPRELKNIDDALPRHKGDEFDEDEYERSKDILVREMRERGFAQARASGRVEVSPEDGTARITYKLDPGERFEFGPVEVVGNREIDPDDIVQAAGISPGDRFKPSTLDLAQQRIYNLGAFSGVRVVADPLGGKPIAPVKVNVREAPFQTTRFGVGGQVETSRVEVPRVRADYTNRNLFGGLRRLEITSTVGFAFVPNITQPTTTGLTTQTAGQMTVPTVFFPGLDFVSRGEFAREIQVGFNYDQVAARAALVYRRGRHAVSPSINFVRYFNSELNGVSITTLSQQQQLGLSQCIPSCNLAYPELRYTFDSRDNVLEPTKGIFATIDFQQTLAPGSFRYFRVEPELRGYTTLGKFGIFAGRIQYGALILEGGNQNPQASPFAQRFFGGGQNFQRGYAPTQQGPQVGGEVRAKNPEFVTPAIARDFYADVDGVGPGHIPVGGNGSALLTLEMRFRTDIVFPHTQFVLFTDISKITERPQLPWEGTLEVAVGPGLRYVTPFGPIRLDVGYTLNPVTQILAASGNVGATRLASSCNNDPSCIRQRPWAYHLTLGEAF